MVAQRRDGESCASSYDSVGGPVHGAGAVAALHQEKEELKIGLRKRLGFEAI